MPVRRPRLNRPESAVHGARFFSALIPSMPSVSALSVSRRACAAALVLAMATAGSLTGIITSNHRHGIAQAAAVPAVLTTTNPSYADDTPTSGSDAVPGSATVPGSTTAAAGLPVVASSKPDSQGQPGVIPVPLAPRAVAGPIPLLAWQAYHYAAAGSGCNLPWYLLAGIGKIESNHGRYGGAQYDITGTVHPAIYGPPTAYGRAMGPMQFIPPTWASYAADGNGDGIANPQNVFDATKAAAHYLCRAGGSDLSGAAAQRRAVFAYNHLDSYVADVLAFATAYSHGASESTVPIVPITYPKAGATTSPSATHPTSSTSTHPGGSTTASTTAATTTAVPTTTVPASPTCTTSPAPSTAQATAASPSAATKSVATKSVGTKSVATKSVATKSAAPNSVATKSASLATTTPATKPPATKTPPTTTTTTTATTRTAPTTTVTPTSTSTSAVPTSRSTTGSATRVPVATSSSAGACPPCPTPTASATTPSVTTSASPTCSVPTSSTTTSAARVSSATTKAASLTQKVVPASPTTASPTTTSPTTASAARAADATAKVVATLTQKIVPLSPPTSAP